MSVRSAWILVKICLQTHTPGTNIVGILEIGPECKRIWILGARRKSQKKYCKGPNVSGVHTFQSRSEESTRFVRKSKTISRTSMAEKGHGQGQG